MGIYQLALIASTLLCSLVAGFLFAFAVVVMPGIRRLGDGEFIRTFQAIDGIIQNSQPVFVVIWLGSILALLATTVAGLWALSGWPLALQLLALLAYLLGVQFPTFTINIPMNNKLQSLSVEDMDPASLQYARATFEGRWNRWNRFRAVVCTLVSAALLFLLASSGYA